MLIFYVVAHLLDERKLKRDLCKDGWGCSTLVIGGNRGRQVGVSGSGRSIRGLFESTSLSLFSTCKESR